MAPDGYYTYNSLRVTTTCIHIFNFFFPSQKTYQGPFAVGLIGFLYRATATTKTAAHSVQNTEPRTAFEKLAGPLQVNKHENLHLRNEIYNNTNS